MVSTRNHPTQFPPPEAATPLKNSSPSKSFAARSSPSSPTNAVARRTTKNVGWSHTPSNLTLIWLGLSLPLVIWDTGYVLGRPYTMPGGSFHSPLYTPYALYGTVDYFYGFPSWNTSDGFTGAQGLMNVVETLLYIWYLALVYSEGVPSSVQGVGAPSKSFIGKLGEARVLRQRSAAIAVLVAFSSAVMTLSKTVLYGLNESFSGMSHTGHNDMFRWTFLWVIPNGAWLVGPTYMTYVFGKEIIAGLEAAATPKKTL